MPMKAVNSDILCEKCCPFWRQHNSVKGDNPLINQTSTVTITKTLTMYGVRHNITLDMYVG